MHADVCSMFARMPRYGPAWPGMARYPQRGTDADDRTKRQLPARASIFWQQLRENKRTEQRTLNPRVRGSSPWRRTRSDLGFHDSRSFFMCPFCPHVCSAFARVHGPSNPGLVKTGHPAPAPAPAPPRSRLDQWSRPSARAPGAHPESPIPMPSRSVKPTGNRRSHDGYIAGVDAPGLVLPGQPQHDRPYIAAQRRAPAATAARATRPAASEDVPMPAQDGAGRDDEPYRGEAIYRQRPGQQRQPCPVRPCQSRMSLRPFTQGD